MTVRIGLLGSGFVAEFYLQGLRHVANWEIPLVYSPNREYARAPVEKWKLGCVADAAHSIDGARHVTGLVVPAVEVVACGVRLFLHDKTEAEDSAVLLMRFADGQLGQAELSWIARGGLDLRNEVYGTEGTIFTDVTRST